ncbi:MAG: DUF368 domain-containing protein [Flavobacteriaceae bacterium]|nr:DUF368 domain-containing protein [Flavobacteriaceae bacterium]
MAVERTHKDKFLLFIKGLAMGAANKVPGVSGGVVAFVAGFYEEFIYSLKKINLKSFKLLFYRDFKTFYRYVNGQFLSFLVLGMLFSYFSVSKLLDYLIEKYELFVWSTFFGMIIASIYAISRQFKAWDIKAYCGIGFGVLVGVGISLMNPAKENDHLLFVFICGVISVSGMTLPGLSGSFILILLGNYVLLLVDSVNALFDTLYEISGFNFSFINKPERIRLLKVLGVFTLGSAVGLVSLSHVLSYMIKHHRKITFGALTGFILGSLGVVWPWKRKVFELDIAGNPLLDSNGSPVLKNYVRYMPEWHAETFYALLFVVLGILIILALEWYGDKNRKQHA